MKLFITAAALALGLSPASAQETPEAQEEASQAAHSHPHTVINTYEVGWGPGPAVLPGVQRAMLYGDPGLEGVFVVRYKFPSDYRVPPHTHEGDEILTVISGEYNVGIGEEFDPSQTKLLTPGGFFVIPAGTPHYTFASEETVVQLSADGPWGLQHVNPDDKAGIVGGDLVPWSVARFRQAQESQ